MYCLQVRKSTHALSFLGFLIWIFVPLGLKGVNTLKLTDQNLEREIHLLEANFEVYEDPEGTSTLAEIVDLASFQPFSSFSPQRYHTYWGRVQIHNTSDQKLRVVFSPDWEMGVEKNGIVDLFVIRGKDTSFYKSGKYVPASEKNTNTDDGINNSFFLPLQPKERLWIYCKVAQIEGKPPVFKPVLLDYAYFKGVNKHERNIIQAIFQGITWSMILYALMTFFITGDRSFFMYALFLSATSFYFLHLNGIFTEWVIRETPKLNLYFWIIFANSVGMSYFEFCRIFLNTKELIPFWDRMGKWMIRIIMGMAIIELIICYLTFNEEILNYLIDSSILVVAVFLLIIIIRYLRTPSIIARIFILGSFCLVIAGIYGVIADLNGILKETLFVIEGLFAGQFLTFALGLGTKIRLTEKEKIAEKAESEKMKELDRIKSQFFANISHEFRTPLTVILGTLEQVQTKWTQAKNGKVREAFLIIRRNTRSLLNLVNQILELTKLESEKTNPNWENGDLIEYLHYLIDSFRQYAVSKSIHLAFEHEEEQLFMDFDPEWMRIIMANLLSNALKFTQSEGTVSLHLYRIASKDQEQVKLQIKDSGIGIARKNLPFIFDRFYQVDGTSTRTREGTGIGLALVKELVQLLGGTIEVQSELGKGTTFTIYLPISQQIEPHNKAVFSPYSTEELLDAFGLYHSPDVEPKKGALDFEKDLILIVEDNSDVMQYLRSFLEEEYRVILASDGKEGVEKALERIPDLILCDLMMPIMDGYEVCHTLKNDARTSHIPLIMLTAKGDQKSKLAGLKEGADAFLVKPILKEELLIRVGQLIQTRNILRERFSAGSFPDHAQSGDKEDAFIGSARKIIEHHLDHTDFSVDQFCTGLDMTYTQVHRKLKALTGKPAKIFIRSVRLQKAQGFLVHSDLNISEIAYKVGFSDPNYFSRAFSQEFEMSPSEYRQSKSG